jgi:chromosome segregation ATPase
MAEVTLESLHALIVHSLEEQATLRREMAETRRAVADLSGEVADLSRTVAELGRTVADLSRTVASVSRTGAETRSEVADIRSLTLALVEQGRRLDRRFTEFRDDIELMVKAELMGRLGHFEIRIENRLSAIEDRLPPQAA